MAHRLTIAENFKSNYITIEPSLWRLGRIRSWFVLSLSLAGWLLLLLALLALADPAFGSRYLDPGVYWASKLLWR
jgi:hypothetical protein